MQQSASPAHVPGGLHVGIIMDGNGRWATARGRLRAAGHREGARAARRVVEAAPGLGIGVLTLFAFSADNWRRPPAEVERCIRNGVRLEVVGRRDRLDSALRDAIDETERATSGGSRVLLRIAIDYSARDAILRAAQCLRDGTVPSRESFTRLLAIVDHGTPVPELDLVIRTGGERRLSDFFLWEAAYAELVFTDTMWPDFGADGLSAAVREFCGRQRRFGGLAGAVAG